MSKDGQDDKNVNNDEISAQLYSGAQVKNVINNIIGRINAFNPTEIQQLKSSAASIATEGLDPEIAHELKDLIASIVKKEKEEKNSLISNILAENQRISDEAAQLQAWKEEMLRFMETQAVYSNFDVISTEYLKQQQDRNTNLDEALEVTKSGGELSKELKAKLAKSSKDIEEEKAKWSKIDSARITAHNEHVYHSTEIEKIDQEKVKLNHTVHADRIVFLNQKKDFHIAQREAAKTKIKETTKHYDERQKEAIKIIKGQELAKNPDIKSFWVDQAKVFENRHGIHPDTAKHPIKVLDQAGKIRQSADQGKDMRVQNTTNDIPVDESAKSKTQQNDKNDSKDKGLGKTDKKTKQWSI